jgi:hypothetical protein
VEIKKKST